MSVSPISGLNRLPEHPIDAGYVAELVIERIFVVAAFDAFKDACREIAQMHDPEMVHIAFAELRRQAELTGLVALHGNVVLRLVVQRAMRLVSPQEPI